LYHEEITPQYIETDFLVIGAGVAGLRAAIELAAAGRVLVLAKDSLHESSSEYAQGGIAAALSDDDEVALHEQDTLNAGAGLCDAEAVRVLVEEGPREIERLISWGAEFDREGSRLSFTREGAHSRNRILHAHGDSTGREIVRALQQKAASMEPIQMHSFSAVTDLLPGEGSVGGVMALEDPVGRQVGIRARAVLLATGGLGRVFINTTNPDVATGDGVAMAYRAGAQIADLEFVQFHPTALHLKGAPRFLLSEALRGEGAVLKNLQGGRFMQSYHAMGDLAPRDVVARGIVSELRRSGAAHVLLDLTGRETGWVAKRFPRIHETCLRYGVDLEREAAPVSPAAHYAMGGVRTDLSGRSNIERLFAAGEAACAGVHGANRLASNSLLEGLVFGRRAGEAMREHAASPLPDVLPPDFARVPEIEEGRLREQTWESCGIIRNGPDLESALKSWDSLPVIPCPRPSRGQHELRNLFDLSRLMARCALAREESRGAHVRSDFPAPRVEFQRHSLVDRTSTNVKFS
jgi:L-aspartate oxidase